jgi:hypothetical protein
MVKHSAHERTQTYANGQIPQVDVRRVQFCGIADESCIGCLRTTRVSECTAHLIPVCILLTELVCERYGCLWATAKVQHRLT